MTHRLLRLSKRSAPWRSLRLSTSFSTRYKVKSTSDSVPPAEKFSHCWGKDLDQRVQRIDCVCHPANLSNHQHSQSHSQTARLQYLARLAFNRRRRGVFAIYDSELWKRRHWSLASAKQDKILQLLPEVTDRATRVISPIRWTSVMFLPTDRLGLTRHPIFTGNVLSLLLESS